MKSFPLILRDTREQTPWEFQGYRHRDTALRLGDYSLYGYKQLITVERKSLADYLSCISKWDEWVRKQLSKLRDFPHAIIIVEGEPSIVQYGKYSTPERAVGKSVEVALHGVPIIFAGTRELAEHACICFLKKAKEIVDSA